MTPIPPSFWTALESVPGATALPTTWTHHIAKSDFDTFKALFLTSRPDALASFVPCPWSCGCLHKVVPRENGTLAGICQCNPANCGEYTVVTEERIPWDLDWPKLGRALCRAFGLDFKIAQLGLFNTLQIGTWEKDAVPAILTIPGSQREFLHAVTMLVARLGRPFILFAPTDRHFGLAAKELLSNLGSVFLPLSDHLTLSPSDGERARERGSLLPQLHLSTLNSQPSTLFSQLIPQIPEQPDQDLASRVCLTLDEFDTGSRRKNPSLTTVFRLYYVQELPVAQVAKKCRCSAGTIMNRLKLLQTKTGATPAQLRRISPHFTQFHEDLMGAKSDYVRRRKYNL